MRAILRTLVSNIGVVVGRARVVKGSWVFTDIRISEARTQVWDRASAGRDEPLAAFAATPTGPARV